LFTQKGTTQVADYIKETKIATRRWLLEGDQGNDGDDEWGWGDLREERSGDGEELE